MVVDVCNTKTRDIKRKISNLEKNLDKIRINKIVIICWVGLSIIGIDYYMRIELPGIDRIFHNKTAHTHEYVNNYCNNHDNPFQLACWRWYLLNSLHDVWRCN